MSNPIIVGTGLVSPFGLGVLEHAFYTRASVAAPPPAAFETNEGERLEVLHCGFLGAKTPPAERLSRLAEIAAHQALAPWEASHGPSGVALAFVAPLRAGIDRTAISHARDRIAHRAKATTVQVWSGAAGAFSALAQARVWLDGGEIPAVLVVAVDSHISVEALSDFFERQDSGFCPRTPPPAEGAAALLLTSQGRASMLGLEEATLLAAATAMGQGSDHDDVIQDGRALTTLIGSMPASRIDLVSGQELVDDLRTRDWCLAYARTAKKFADPPMLVTLEEEVGRLGAAAGIGAIAFGVGQLRHGVFPNLSPGATLLAWAISPDGTRGVSLVCNVASTSSVPRGGQIARVTSTHGVPRESALGPTSRERLSAMILKSADEGAEAAPEDEAADESPEIPETASLLDNLLGVANDVSNEPNAQGSHPEKPGEPKVESTVRHRKEKGDPVSLAITYKEIVATCLDGIALAARHRMILPREQRTREEERILSFTDALLVTPRFVSSLAAWWEEAADLPDPWKVWAPVFVLGCLGGDDVAEGLAKVLAAVPEEEAETAVIAGEALALAPGSDRLARLAVLAKNASPVCRGAALTAYALAGALSPEALLSVFLKEESRTVRWAAVKVAARMPAPERRIDEMLFAEVHKAPDADFLYEVLAALALRGHATGYHAMRHDPALLSRLGGRALDVLALFGDASDATLARTVVGRSGLTTAVLSGLGRYGHPGAAPMLLRALGDEDHAEDAARALVWMFGMPFDENDIESPDAWKKWFRTTRFPEDTRLRFGKMYSPACVAAEVDEGQRSQVDIAWMVDEAHVRCGLTGAPDLSAWSPAADATLSPVLSALSRETAPFAADPWRSVTRKKRGAS